MCQKRVFCGDATANDPNVFKCSCHKVKSYICMDNRVLLYLSLSQHHGSGLIPEHYMTCELTRAKMIWLQYWYWYRTVIFQLSHACRPYNPGRVGCCSASQHLLTKLRAYHSCGDRSFRIAAPRLGKSLYPNIASISSLNSFKTSLITHLMKVAYNGTVQVEHLERLHVPRICCALHAFCQ